jgi:hypothetical protein
MEEELLLKKRDALLMMILEMERSIELEEKVMQAKCAE